MLSSITLIALIGLGCSVPVIQDDSYTAIPTGASRAVRQVAYTSAQPPVASSDPIPTGGPKRAVRQAEQEEYSPSKPPAVLVDPIASTVSTVYRAVRQAAYTTVAPYDPSVATSGPYGPYRAVRQVVGGEPQTTANPAVQEAGTGATNYQPVQGNVYNYPAKQPQNPEYQPSLKVPVA
ncbi:unnamed protein product [Bursaphelenchus xylophilus]|uniref:(pine wood nematode) hypothetical protein n=1 Tax=Bursaphelenchus xylophilus TaxID=6326 RepID=A0A1I7SX34_BURXY|nr:unnamed protein product [Bursaphelenchus xylophilus]CAG9100144.1 unnamed protein product [Bursaphelenchus xylophilus]